MQDEIADFMQTISTGVYVIGVCDGERTNAFTASSVTPVSYKPLVVALAVGVDHVRSERRTRPIEPSRSWAQDQAQDGDREATIGDESAARALAATLDRDVLRRALLVLPENHRRLLVLRFLDGLEPDELCSVLVCSRATLAVRLHRALRALREAVARESSDAA